MSWELLDEHLTATGVLRRQTALVIGTDHGVHRCVVMCDLPPDGDLVPAFLGLNFRGNHTLTVDDAVLDPQHLPGGHCGDLHYEGLREPVTLPVPRGIHAHQWPSELVTSRGCAAITACYLQCGPDSPGIFTHGIAPLLGAAARTGRGDHEWGAIGIWAWMLSRILDALRDGMVPQVDPARVAVLGHSRLGKAALWAAAQDDRFAAAISNDSGCMGAAPSRPPGETPDVLARIRPQWFAPRFSDVVLGGHPLPVEQHHLLAAIAPRPLYVASASEDANADPAGEFASLLAAAPAWGLEASGAAPPFPAPDTVWHSDHAPLGYHLRRGGHEMMPWDWMQWLSFAERWL